MRVYVGTYTETVHFSSGKIVEGKGKGIYCLEFDPISHRLDMLGFEPGVTNPSYIAISDDGKFLYAAGETKECRGGHYGGEIGAYSIDDSGNIHFINSTFTDGWDSCHVAVDKNRTHAIVSNYGSCTVALFEIEKDGRVRPHCQFITHEGSSVHPKRQKKAFPHSAIFSPDGRFLYVLDLGMDKIAAYKVDFSNHQMIYDEGASFTMRPGSGPRHAEWHPDEKRLFVVDELSCEITCLTHDSQTGKFSELQTVRAVLDGQTGDFTSADIHITPNGEFVYASTRGHNSIAAYRIDKDTGALRAVGEFSSGGVIPRGFAIDPSGSCLLAANQNTDNIVIFDIHKDGTLSKAGEISIPNPVCVKFIK